MTKASEKKLIPSYKPWYSVAQLNALQRADSFFWRMRCCFCWRQKPTELWWTL